MQTVEGRLERIENKVDTLITTVAVHGTMVKQLDEHDQDIKNINQKLNHQSGWLRAISWVGGIVTTIFTGLATLHAAK